MSTGMLDRKRERLDESHDCGEITDGDYDLIAEFISYDRGENKDRTVANHVAVLRATAVRSDVPLAEMDADAVNDLLERFKAGIHPDVKDEGIVVKNYQSALRKFYRHHGHLNVDDEREIDAEDDDYNGRDLSPGDVLYREEVDELFDVARRRSIRDLAALALMLSTGLRIDAVRTLRLKHVKTDGPTMEITLNQQEGDLKGASGSRALLWAKHYVRPWYESHPYKGDGEAALFPPEKNGNNFRSGDRRHRKEPMKDRGFRRMVHARAEEADLGKKVYPHLFRHSAITRMAVDDDLSEQQIKNIVGWHGDSSQFEKYVTLADEIATDSVREALGLPTSESGTPVVGRPTLDRCPGCNDQLPANTERCPTCKTPLTHSEAEKESPEPETPGPGELAEIMQEELGDVNLSPEQATEVGTAVSKALGRAFGGRSGDGDE